MSEFYCECNTVSGWAHIGDQWWVHPACGKPSKMFWEMKMGFESTTVWATPPRGITKSTVRIGPDIRHHYTYFCEASEECYAVAYAMTEDGARRELDGHICPAPVRSDMMPSSRTAVQKMWDELDWVVAAIKDPDSSEEDKIRYKAMAQAMALFLAFVSVPYFRSRDDILRQANRRWRMSQDEIPWEATPGYNFYPAAPLAYAKSEPERKPEAKLGRGAVNGTGRLTREQRAQKEVAAAPRDFTVPERTMIQESVHRNGVSIEDLAKMFGVTPERIRTIAGPSFPGDDNPLMPIAMF